MSGMDKKPIWEIGSVEKKQSDRRSLMIAAIAFGLVALAVSAHWLNTGEIVIHQGTGQGPVVGQIKSDHVLFYPVCAAWGLFSVSMLVLAPLAYFRNDEFLMEPLGVCLLRDAAARARHCPGGVARRVRCVHLARPPPSNKVVGHDKLDGEKKSACGVRIADSLHGLVQLLHEPVPKDLLDLPFCARSRSAVEAGDGI